MALLSKSATLVDTSRGETIDDALIEALETGRIFAAGRTFLRGKSVLFYEE